MEQKLRNFVFTINNWTEEDYEACENLYEKYGKYMVIGQEIGKECGTPHLQGYMEVKNPLSKKSISKQLKRAFIQKRFGTALEAANYCKKEENYQEWGEISHQGERCDIEQVYKLAKDKKKINDLIELKPNLQCIKVFEIASQIYQEDRNFKPEVTWIWGPTGGGKTRYVYEHEDPKNIWKSGRNLRWWIGYENQEVALFDDFRADFCPFYELLIVLDRFPHFVEVKGGQRKFNSKRIYITSCYSPYKVYKTDEDIKQLTRRIDNIMYIDQNGTIVSEQKSSR